MWSALAPLPITLPSDSKQITPVLGLCTAISTGILSRTSSLISTRPVGNVDLTIVRPPSGLSVVFAESISEIASSDPPSEYHECPQLRAECSLPAPQLPGTAFALLSTPLKVRSAAAAAKVKLNRRMLMDASTYNHNMFTGHGNSHATVSNSSQG